MLTIQQVLILVLLFMLIGALIGAFIFGTWASNKLSKLNDQLQAVWSYVGNEASATVTLFDTSTQEFEGVRTFQTVFPALVFIDQQRLKYDIMLTVTSPDGLTVRMHLINNKPEPGTF